MSNHSQKEQGNITSPIGKGSSSLGRLSFLLFSLFLLAFSFTAGTGAGFFASLVKDEPIRSFPDMKKDIYNYSETSEVYFQNQIPLGSLRTDLEREEIRLDQVSKYIIHAVIATEDEYFYEHKGIVPKAILRAIFQGATQSSVQSGGSTLTQQLIKNQILTNEVSFERKAKEILLALRLERFFTKEEILQAYLNVATFGRNSAGRNIAGVQTAAKGIFGVEASQLTLPQAAFIAGLPQSPFAYTPFNQDGELKENLAPGINRMQTVLRRMLAAGYINDKEFKEASAYNIKNDFLAPIDPPSEKYPWLTMEIEKRAVRELAAVMAKNDGISITELRKKEELYREYLLAASRNLRQKGYQIHTTINKDIYEAMQTAKDEYPYFGPDKPQAVKDPDTGENITKREPVEVGAILIENKTGKILSFVGGRDYKREQLNHATSAIRQNGSTMKPLLVYGPAIELGKASPAKILPDVPLKLDPSSSNTWPANYDKKYSGLVTARLALAKSLNVPAVKLYTQILSYRPALYLEKMGFTSLLPADFTNPATALGSMERGVTVEENTNAFGTFANGGKFVDAYMIEKITDKNGELVFQHETEPVDVFSPQTAYLTLDMMRDVVSHGTAAAIKRRLKFQSDWAGKTGTGVDFHDAWFVASNPNVSFGIWTGYDTPKSLKAAGPLNYSLRNNYLWADLINSAYEAEPELIDPDERFAIPDGIVKRPFCLTSGLLPSETCSRAGLVGSDLYNIRHAPSELDNSLYEGSIIKAGGKNYAASPSAPADFIQQGFILNADFISRLTGPEFTDFDQLIPKKEKWRNVAAAGSVLNDNGKQPAAPQLTVKGNTLIFNGPAENDVIGYRVYAVSNGYGVVASVRSDTPSFQAGAGTYFVKAVDSNGNESPPSNLVEISAGPTFTAPDL